MTYILAFHPDNVIRRDGKQDVTLADFKAANPLVPLVDGQWFQLDCDRLIVMDAKGQGNEADMVEYADLIKSIKTPALPAADKFYPVDIAVDAYLELDSIKITAPTNEGVPTGFTVVADMQVWQYREKTIEELLVDSTDAALLEVARLESEITSRRLREAVLGTDGGWLAAQEAYISIQRVLLS